MKSNDDNQGRSISGRQAPFATICAEVLDRILSNFKYHKREYDYTAYDVYLPFTLVNHHWYAVANRRLYLHVASGKAHDAEILLNTLRARPDLAGTVRSINFSTSFYRQDTENHAAIIRLSHNVAALKLYGLNGFARAPLLGAVRDAHTLRSIYISRVGTYRDIQGDAFCSGLELLRVMHMWPGIEEVVIYPFALSVEYPDDLMAAPESDSSGESDDEPGSTHDWSNATPCLRDVQFYRISDSLDNNTFLRRFVRMASNLQHFRVDMTRYSALHALDGLRLCLRTWRHSLRTLRISIACSHYQPTDGDAKSGSIDDAVSELTALQALSVSDDLVLPRTLRRCVAPIEYFHYRGSAEHMLELVDVLSSLDVLPTLRVFQPSHKDPRSGPQTVLLERDVLVNPQSWYPCDDPRERDAYGPSEPLKEKVLNYYGDNSDSDDDEEDDDSFDEDQSAE